MRSGIGETIESYVPARLDRMPWSSWHWLIVLSLGATWILDGLEVTLAGSLSGTLTRSETLNLGAIQVGASATCYLIGAVLYDSVGHWLIEIYGLGGKVEAFRASYAEWGALIIIGKGLTPIPYKLVTITSGFAGYNIWLFVLCSIVARGGRFFVVAILLNRYGEWIRVRIERHLGLWVSLGAGVLVAGFVVAVRLI